ncbi:MAG: response regulator [Armatimonadetes bacterium]|nr:response regulator [Armatimonadota bacterium]
MRHSGIDIVGDVPWGTHLCQFYETGQDLVDTLVPFFREGLANNEFCMWVTSPPLEMPQARAALTAVVPDLEWRVAAGQIELLDYREWYTPSGKFRVEEVLQGWDARLTAARERGFVGLRFTGNTFWLEEADWEDFTHYEAVINSVIGQHPVLAVCTYYLPRCGATEIIDVVVNHQFALIKRAGRWDVIESAQQRKMEQALRASEEQLRAQSVELQIVNEELEVRSEELRAAKEALRLRADALYASQERLREADRRKDEFLAMLAHELRNPLAAITNALHFMTAHSADDPARRRAQEAAVRQADHMARLLDDLLDVSRITEGKVTLRKERVSLAAVLQNALESARPLVEARQQRLNVVLPPETIHLDADPVRLAQVVGNLLHNAAKYTPHGGELCLAARCDDGQVEIRVRDRGIGIAPEVLPHIFDLFVQADASPAHTQGGLGIGLTMARVLVEMHGGHIEASSAGPGKGSGFVVRLQLPTAESDPRPQPAGQPSRGAAHRRILVVDDNTDAAEMLAALLELDGHEILTANSGPAALALAESFAPEVALLDIGMPGMDGYTVARHLRRKLESALLVAVTGYGQEEDRQRSRAAGFDYHLTKPVSLDAVRRILQG